MRGLLINIFGGIMRCDVLAQGVVDAARELSVSVPLVVRMQGTNVDIGKKILADSGLAIIPAETMAEAAEKIVAAVKDFGLEGRRGHELLGCCFRYRKEIEKPR